jgi:phosphate transport system protein
VAEEGVLAEIGELRSELLQAGEAATTIRPEACSQVVKLACRSREHYAQTHDRLLCLIARQGPVAGDLRLAVALLHVNDRLARISSQCVNIATLCRQIPAGTDLPRAQLHCLGEMVRLADEALGEAASTFADRDRQGVARLLERDQAINEHNRRCFALAVQANDKRVREAGFFAAMMARAIERIGDNAVDIARQAAFVSTGELRADPEPRLASERVEQHQREPRRRVAQGPWLVAAMASVVKALRRLIERAQADRRRRTNAGPNA